eukprot:gene46346-60627_t
MRCSAAATFVDAEADEVADGAQGGGGPTANSTCGGSRAARAATAECDTCTTGAGVPLTVCHPPAEAAAAAGREGSCAAGGGRCGGDERPDTARAAAVPGPQQRRQLQQAQATGRVPETSPASAPLADADCAEDLPSVLVGDGVDSVTLRTESDGEGEAAAARLALRGAGRAPGARLRSSSAQTRLSCACIDANCCCIPGAHMAAIGGGVGGGISSGSPAKGGACHGMLHIAGML